MENCKVFLSSILLFHNKIVIFAVTDSATLPIEQRTRAELLLYIDLWNTQNSR